MTVLNNEREISSDPYDSIVRDERNDHMTSRTEINSMVAYKTIDRLNHSINVLKVLGGIFIFKITTIDHRDII